MALQLAPLLRTGLALKMRQVRSAVAAYAQDRAGHGKDIAVGYAVAAGLYAAAGVFVIAACLVGVTALFRWIELHEGTFAAFGIVGGVLLALAIICAAIAASALQPKAQTYPGLGTRLKIAIKGNPITSARVTSTPPEKLARSIPPPAAAPARPRPFRLPRSKTASPIPARAGLVVAATLFGWAMARRLSYPRKPDA